MTAQTSATHTVKDPVCGMNVDPAKATFVPSFGVLLSPIIAAAAMSLNSVSVIGNALRLRQADV